MSNDLKKEILTIKTASEKQASKGTIELLKVYKRNLDDVRDQTYRIYVKYTVDGKLNISSQQRYSELVALERQLVTQMQELGDTAVSATTDILHDVYRESYYKTAYTIEKGTQGIQSFAPLKHEFVRAATNAPIEGKTFSSRIWDNTNALANRIKTDVEKAMLQGQSLEKLARQIKADFGSTAYQAQRVISTETAKAVTAAQDEIYRSSGVVQQVMWDATLEENTCDECAENDGEYYPIDDHPDLPAHPNCRCALIPVVEGWEPTQKRENIKDPFTGEKTVIDYTSYSAWRASRGIDEE